MPRSQFGQSDPYVILGLKKSADATEIKTRYRKLAAQHHPDQGGDPKTFRRVQEAYEILSDPVKRRAWDSSIYDQTFNVIGRFVGVPPARVERLWKTLGAEAAALTNRLTRRN